MSTATTVERLRERAMALAVEEPDEAAATIRLRWLAQGDREALDLACAACLAEPASLAVRHRAIQLLCNVLYDNDLSAPDP